MRQPIETQLRTYFERVEETHGPLSAGAVIDRTARVQEVQKSEPPEKHPTPALRRLAWAIALIVFVGVAYLSRAIDSDAPPVGEITTTIPGTLPPNPLSIGEFQMIDQGPLSVRRGHSVVWTGSELLVWGGRSGADGEPENWADGAAFNPASNSWRVLAESPLDGRSNHVAVWTGDEMVVIGGAVWEYRASDDSMNAYGITDGAAYDPATDQWRPIAGRSITKQFRGETLTGVWTGTDLVVWDAIADLVGAYSVADDVWVEVPSVGLPPAAGSRLEWWGGQLYAISIEPDEENEVLNVARFDDGRWVRLASADVNPDGVSRSGPNPGNVGWTGSGIIAWSDGGSNEKTLLYDSATDFWEEVDPIPLVACIFGGSSVSFPGAVLAFNACDEGNAAIYNSGTGQWSLAREEVGGSGDYAIWTGSEVLMWGEPIPEVVLNHETPPLFYSWRYAPDIR